jgi:hypothetical protein
VTRGTSLIRSAHTECSTGVLLSKGSRTNKSPRDSSNYYPEGRTVRGLKCSNYLHLLRYFHRRSRKLPETFHETVVRTIVRFSDPDSQPISVRVSAKTCVHCCARAASGQAAAPPSRVMSPVASSASSSIEDCILQKDTLTPNCRVGWPARTQRRLPSRLPMRTCSSRSIRILQSRLPMRTCWELSPGAIAFSAVKTPTWPHSSIELERSARTQEHRNSNSFNTNISTGETWTSPRWLIPSGSSDLRRLLSRFSSRYRDTR